MGKKTDALGKRDYAKELGFPFKLESCELEAMLKGSALESFIDSHARLLDKPGLSESEKSYILRYSDYLRHCKESLAYALPSIHDDVYRKSVVSIVDLSLAAGFLASRNPVIELDERQIKRIRRKAAQHARDAKALKTKPEIERRREIIATKFKLESLGDSEKFAGSIEPEMNEEFRREKLKPVSARTIRRDIQAILKGHSDRMRRK